MGNLSQFNLGVSKAPTMTNTSKPDFNTIDARLATTIEARLNDWFPNKKITRSGEGYRVGDSDGLSVEPCGLWHDFTGKYRKSGGKGLLSLYANVHGIDIKEAAAAFADIDTTVTRSKEPPLPQKHDQLGKPDHVYEYRDTNGRIKGAIMRWNKTDERSKEIRQLSVVDGAWTWKQMQGKSPLYGSEYLLSKRDAPVLIVEGEKCVEALRDTFSDYIVMTWCGGSSAVENADWASIEDRSVKIWPDNDKPGAKAASKIMVHLPSCVVLDIPEGRETGWDGADAIDEGFNVVDFVKSVAPPTDVDFFAMMNDMTVSTVDRLAELKQRAQDAIFILPQVALRGELTLFNAQYNTGKTLLALWLLKNRDMEATKDMQIFYINADDSYNGGVEKTEWAMDFGVKMLIPNQFGFGTDMLLDLMRLAITSGGAQKTVFILDTLKKFVDTMNKGQAKEFNDKAREFTQAGGTLIALAHTNKNRDGDGKSIAEGVGDFHSDFDCAYTIEKVESITSSTTRTVAFEKKKMRGPVKQKVTFSYDCSEDATWMQRFDSIKRLDDKDAKKQVEGAKADAQFEEDKSIIAYIKDALKDGAKNKSTLTQNDLNKSSGSRTQRERVIATYNENNPDESRRFWGESKNHVRGWSCYLLEDTEQPLPWHSHRSIA
jgi:hypothetical protein